MLTQRVTGKPGQRLKIEAIPLDIGRKLVQIDGTIDEISQNRDNWRGNIAKVIVDLDEPLSQLDERVRSILTDTRIVSVAPRYQRPAAAAVTTASDSATQTISELFSTYLADSPTIRDPERVNRYFNILLDGVARGDEDRPFPDLDEVLK